MTDQFISDDNSDKNTNTNLQNSDQAAAGGNGDQDTKSVEHQLQMLQKRVDDKDAYIKQLETEGKTFRESLSEYEERMKNMEDITKLLEQGGQQQASGSNQETALDENAVAEKVINTLSQREMKERMDENWQEVESRVKQEFGDSAAINEKMQQYAKDNGLTVADMKETAKKSPQAFYKLVGLEGGQQQRQQSPQPTRSSMQGVSYETNTNSLDYYNRLMREDWKTYMKPEVQREYRKLLLEQNKN